MTRATVIVFGCVLFVFLVSLQPVSAGCRDFFSLLHDGAYALADSQGRIVSSCNEDVPYVPASLVKLPLALAAFAILGPDFRFATDFYLDGEDNLFIRGTGDPFLVSEEVSLILDRLRDAGVERINSIFIDDGFFALEEPTPGRRGSDNPYDVPPAAVAVNFNTVNILVAPGGSISPAEPQTPFLPLMDELGAGREPGEYRLNICRPGCDPVAVSARHTAELFRGLQERKKIPGSGREGRRRVAPGARLVYRHLNTRTLRDVVREMLRYSNNFIANQIFLSCGAARFGEPATWEKARKALWEYLNGLKAKGHWKDDFVLEDGAGLSRKNRLTARVLLELLFEFKPYRHLLPEAKGVRVKSGTLTGVYNYAGYLPGTRPFVILLNQRENTRDRLLEKLSILAAGEDAGR
ncbi:MAG: serine-type D-Ala-D-Ala carboxypeptidase [Desulfobulbaceae bacterium]